MHRCDDDYGYKAEDYLRCFENAIKCDPGNAEAYQELGYVLDVYLSDYDGAGQAFKKAIDLGAGHESYYGYARVLAQKGRTNDAINSLSETSCPFHDHPAIRALRSEIADGSWSKN
jgi:tetratricopeptide (TPR) repeat protein